MAGAQQGVTFALKQIVLKQKRAPGGRATAKSNSYSRLSEWVVVLLVLMY